MNRQKASIPVAEQLEVLLRLKYFHGRRTANCQICVYQASSDEKICLHRSCYLHHDGRTKISWLESPVARMSQEMASYTVRIIILSVPASAPALKDVNTQNQAMGCVEAHYIVVTGVIVRHRIGIRAS